MNKVCIFKFFKPGPGEFPASYCKSWTISVFNLNATGLFIFYVFNLCSILGIVSHFRCAMANPGTVPQNIYVPEHIKGRVNFCKKGCKTWKPDRAHHCSECKQCIMRVSLLSTRWTTTVPGSTIVWALQIWSTSCYSCSTSHWLLGSWQSAWLALSSDGLLICRPWDVALQSTSKIRK